MLPVLLASLLLLTSFATAAPARPILKQIAIVSLPGRPTRLDYQTLDAGRHLLFIAHLGDSEVTVVNTGTRSVVGTVPGINRVHGVLAVPSLNTVYASATGTDQIVAINETTLKITGRAPGGVYPDGIAFDPEAKRLFISDEVGKTETIIDTRTNERIATLHFGAEIGNTQYDPRSRTMFVNVESGELIEIDPATARITRRIPLPGCKSNHGLLINPTTDRAFIACADNAKLVVLDMHDMHPIAALPIGADPDVLALDTRRHRVYVAAESGVVSIVDDGRTVSLMAREFLAPHAHTVAYDPGYDVLYFPLQNIASKPALSIMQPR